MKIKSSTQRTQRKEEKTGDIRAGQRLRLVLQRRAWYMGKAENCED